MVSKDPVPASAPTTSRLPRAFHEQPPVAKILAAVVAPAVLGAISGLVLGLSAPVYWLLQVVAVIGGLLAGLEHHGAAAGAVRGLVGGGLFGAFILLVRAVSGLDDHVSLGSTPAFVIVITALAGAVLGAVGGLQRSRMLRRR